MADRIVVMNHGVIEQVGTPTEIYREPATLFVADFIGAMNKLPVRVVDEDHVQTGETVLRCRPHRFVAGSEVTLAVRPEDVDPGESDAGAGGANRLDVTVSEMEFLGSFWRARLSGSAFGRAAISADFSVNAVRRLGIADGAGMSIALPVDRLHVFPGVATPEDDTDG